MAKEFSIGMAGEGGKGRARLPLSYPLGKHSAEIMSVEYVPSELVKSGNPYFLWGLETTEERIPFEVVTTTKKGSRWLLKQLLSACGIEAKEEDEEERYDFDREDVIGKTILFTVIHRENTYTKKEEAEVNRFEKVEKEEEPIPKSPEKTELTGEQIKVLKAKMVNELIEGTGKKGKTITWLRKTAKQILELEKEPKYLTDLSIEEIEKLVKEVKNEVPF